MPMPSTIASVPLSIIPLPFELTPALLTDIVQTALLIILFIWHFAQDIRLARHEVLLEILHKRLNLHEMDL